jgi:hypothetical protein
MLRKGHFIVFSVLMLTMIFMATSAQATLITQEHTVEIETTQEGIQVIEDITLENEGADNVTSFQLWIQQDASDISIAAGGTNLASTVAGNTYTCNLTRSDIVLLPDDTLDIHLTYTLPTATENYYEKTLLYDTTLLSVEFNQKKLYQAEHQLSADSSFKLLLYRPSEAPLDITIIIGIFLLVVILILSTLYLLRKQRTKTKTPQAESEELLTTKKALLMSVLKDIEKQHRSQDISDDTYTKLKEEFKQQTVEVMKKLEDLK